MPTTLAPVAPGPQPRTRWTVTQFNRMGDMGWFEGRRAFLLDGVILENGPMNPLHANAVGFVQYALMAAFGPPEWWVRVQSPFHVDEFNDPLPDFAVVSGTPDDYDGRHPTEAALVVEVADTSLGYDLREKAERYATAGVPDYWVLDLDGRELHVFRDPVPLPAGLGATAYRDQRILTTADSVSPLAMPAALIAVARLFPRERN